MCLSDVADPEGRCFPDVTDQEGITGRLLGITLIFSSGKPASINFFF
jgi:hypothetical protein